MIAIVYPQFYGVGGIARYLDSFLSNLPTDHPPIYLITGNEYQEARVYPGVEIIHIPFSSNRFNLFLWGFHARRLLIRLHGQGKIKLINLHFPPLIPCLFLPRNIPVVLTVHSTYLGMSGNYYPEKYYVGDTNYFALRIKMWMESRIYKNSSRAITLTEFGREQVLAYGYDKPISIIPNGVDLNHFQPSTNSKKDIDVVFAGRIERLKGSNGMVEICRRLVEKKKDILILIVGYGDEEASVRQQLSELSANIIMTGKVPFAEMMEFYSRSRVYASTSYYEGLPGTCLEAMSMQLPVVVWDFLFYRGLVIEGKTGVLVPPNDFDVMVQEIMALLADEEHAKQMGRAGRALLASNYNWSNLAAEILDVCEC